MIDATIIIGLLILLTFSSVTSSFVQEEQSAFFAEWYAGKQELRTMDELLTECKKFKLETEPRQQLGETFMENSLWIAEEKSEDEMKTRSDYEKAIFSNWFSKYEEKILARCDEIPAAKFELNKKIKVLDQWGEEFCYLEYDDKKSQMVESKYHKDLALAPFLANMVNLGMIFPFLISAIAEIIVNSKKAVKDDQGSKIGIAFMVIGFAAMVIGLSIIAFSFYQASEPFLEFNRVNGTLTCPYS